MKYFSNNKYSKQYNSKESNKYTKKKKGISYIKEQMNSINENIAYLEGINEELIIANHTDAEQIREDLINNGYIRAKVKTKNKKKI